MSALPSPYALPIMEVSHAEEPLIAKKPLFPIYDMMESWAAFAFSTPEAKPQHHALYYALIHQCKVRRGMRRFPLAYQHGMQISSIGSKSTYLNTLYELQEWGFITYEPGANAYKSPIVEVHFRESTGNQVDLYRYSYEESTDTSTGNNNKELSTEVTKIKKHTTPVAAIAASSEFKKFKKALASCKTEAEILEYWNSLSKEERPVKDSKEFALFRERKEELLVSFDIFWKTYGQTRGSKPNARKRWEKMDTETKQIIIAGLPAYRATISDKQYIPNATTFLNGKIWDNEAYGKKLGTEPRPERPKPTLTTALPYAPQEVAPSALAWLQQQENDPTPDFD